MLKSASVLVMGLTFSAFSAGWGPEAHTVTRIHTESTSNFIGFETTGGQATYNGGCESNKWVVVGTDEQLKNRVYTMLLTAKTTGMKIRIWWDNGCGTYNYNKASAIQLLD